jgi:hypothetical protein
MWMYVGAMAGALMSVGLTADPAPGFFIAAKLEQVPDRWFSGSLEVRYLAAARAIEEPSGNPFALSTGMVALVPCVRWKWFLGCISGDIAMSVVSDRTPAPREPLLVSFGLGPRVAVQIQFASLDEVFALRVFGDVRISPEIPSQEIDYKYSPVAALLGAAVVFN